MRRKAEIIVIFVLGLFAGINLTLARQNPSSGSISSRLPELIFPKSSSPLTIVFTGDVMLGRSVNTRIQKYTDPTWPFKNISSLLSTGDLTIINLESPFITGCRSTDTGMIFCADPKNVFGLVTAGVDMASLANNHINNQGQEGKAETISILETNGITPVGLGKAEFSTVKNTSLAVLSFSDLPQIDEKEVEKQIFAASKSADLVITTFHWGAEYRRYPTPRQVFLAHLAIDSGADIVVGHHPHWIQTEEIYLGKPIYYSLGNLVFDQMWSEETRLGEILRVTYQDGKLMKKEVFPVKIFDYGQPNFYSTSDLK
ncbi:MAG: SH3 type 3 domain protein [Candidatus Collierbacteria bacterium GW2011_GWA1_42_60]|uniref:SH3 type 3 domain protein n=1 Tax=Candidatus Collierbacteria bacterium GW2011_GWA2_42_17 TaxID=1618378 RepID=A0A0G0Z3I8_9BACT|nr:MAG: SH3 type 3 domain protein [Candidatus Collierbacteria bacterium GW2011_GWB2_42_12]KKS43324.1 MAG: SH3 type 3 domain protein [Candidatus Collierbacteria bacterium GW2011_GWA2_42_17]KKS61534.1 MAG: SH3 type 3 domain protein [Candidatus Collierbacteria bacterium GW2011_GWE2_42_48]KKS61722.1 MAG: SH3 type 3 domain protein [Candidatus Collierbacteria bacterium GW2011_GWD2_42_50]KKS62263.1 MAG: SH3 type 3 domain protein [Candidatus Collierbacteria bacterium GW2011_GWF1_42_50]KKS66557.1 MAG: 